MDRNHHSISATNAGMLDLEHEIADSSNADLVEQISLLIETPAALLPMTMPRLRLATYELRKRLQASESEAAA